MIAISTDEQVKQKIHRYKNYQGKGETAHHDRVVEITQAEQGYVVQRSPKVFQRLRRQQDTP